MSRKKQILINTALLTASTLLLRMVGMVFQAWMASRIGAKGIGLYQLSGSVTMLFSVFAVSGVRFASAKLVSEESAAASGNIPAVIKCCTVYALCSGTLSLVMLLAFAEPLAFLWVGDARIELSLRIAAAAAPFIALSAMFIGYFTARGTVWKIVLSQLLSTLICVATTIYLLLHSNPLDLKATCADITIGSVASELFGFVILLIFFLGERQQNPMNQKTMHFPRRMLSAALPLAFSSYTRTGLSTVEHMMIPKGLQLYGLSAEAALAGYGIVHGMALTAILFPSCLLFSLAELIVPELTRSQANGQIKRVLHITQYCRIGSLVYAAASAVVLFLSADAIADRIFHTPECSRAIRILAPLIPIMNLDTITDGCLRGLGQQSRVMAINILDAGLGVFFVLMLLPRSGLKGYVQMIWITEIVNCMLSSIALTQTLRKCKASGT